MQVTTGRCYKATRTPSHGLGDPHASPHPAPPTLGCGSLGPADGTSIGDDSMRTSQLNVGTSTDVSLKITETDLSLLTASIRAPSGNEEPCLLKRLPNRHIGAWGTWRCGCRTGTWAVGWWVQREGDTSLGDVVQGVTGLWGRTGLMALGAQRLVVRVRARFWCLRAGRRWPGAAGGEQGWWRWLTVVCPPPGISFTPKEVGEHIVSVKKSGQHVTNSPFKILVGQSEIGDASRVKVWGKGLVEGHTFEVAEFIVDTRSAGETVFSGTGGGVGKWPWPGCDSGYGCVRHEMVAIATAKMGRWPRPFHSRGQGRSIAVASLGWRGGHSYSRGVAWPGRGMEAVAMMQP